MAPHARSRRWRIFPQETNEPPQPGTLIGFATASWSFTWRWRPSCSTGAGLLVRSVVQLQSSDPGFDPRGVLVVPVLLDNQAYDSGEKTRTYYRTLFERLAALPGVTAVGGATTVPNSPIGADFARPVWPEGSTPDPAQHTTASVRMVTPGYLRALGLRIVDGRPIDDTDSPQSPRVLMVSQTLASRLWPGGSAVGKRLVVDYSTAGTYAYEIVGVVNDLQVPRPAKRSAGGDLPPARAAPVPDLERGREDRRRPACAHPIGARWR